MRFEKRARPQSRSGAQHRIPTPAVQDRQDRQPARPRRGRPEFAGELFQGRGDVDATNPGGRFGPRGGAWQRKFMDGVRHGGPSRALPGDQGWRQPGGENEAPTTPGPRRSTRCEKKPSQARCHAAVRHDRFVRRPQFSLRRKASAPHLCRLQKNRASMSQVKGKPCGMRAAPSWCDGTDTRVPVPHDCGWKCLLETGRGGKGGQGVNRTLDTRIFSPLLYRLSYLPVPRGRADAREAGLLPGHTLRGKRPGARPGPPFRPPKQAPPSACGIFPLS